MNSNIIVIMIMVAMGVFFFLQYLADRVEVPIDYQDYIVKSGDTLWSIAREHKPGDVHMQKYIYEIKQINNLGEHLHPGQKITIIKEVE